MPGSLLLTLAVAGAVPDGAQPIRLLPGEVPHWRDMAARAERDSAALAGRRCMLPAEEPGPGCAYRGWQRGLEALRGRAVGEQLEGVQRAVNALRYVGDRANWGVADRWQTPWELFARGGDCEDFAITKYFALRGLGFPDAAMRVAVVWDAEDREQHAVLVVESGGGRWVLDNKLAMPVPAERLAARYRPIYAVNGAGAVVTARAGRVRLVRGRLQAARSALPAIQVAATSSESSSATRSAR